jgi:hypothetical protein
MAVTSPQLQIFSFEVVDGHGAGVSQIHRLSAITAAVVSALRPELSVKS